MLVLSEAASPDANFTVIGISAVSGNIDVDSVFVNIGRVLQLYRIEDRPPVYIGCAAPLIEPHKRATEYHGQSPTARNDQLIQL